MKTKSKIAFSFLLLLITPIVILTSCEQNADLCISTKQELQSVKLRLDVTKTDFEGQGVTRSGISNTGWQDGETIYLLFSGYGDDGLTKGTVIYNASSKTWTLTYNGTLFRDTEAWVGGYYFENSTTANSSKVTLSPSTGVYSGWSGSYYFPTNGELVVKLNLEPHSSRLRFKGEPGTIISVDKGITTYSEYNLSTSEFSDKDTTINLTVQDDGYTPYIYGHTKESTNLLVTNGKYQYSTVCPPMSDAGKSGWMSIPTESMHANWEKTPAPTQTFTVVGNGKTVTFNMKLVEAGSFQMGHYQFEDYVHEGHQVTLKNDYYIGQTEVTQALWRAVMGQTQTGNNTGWTKTYGLGDNYPAYYISYEDCEQFINKLNSITGHTFRFPTEEEWEFAAWGGNKGYYGTNFWAGSYFINFVAWWNSNSSGTSHPVMMKDPNPLNLYDMSGNVWEWCYDRVRKGGCWDSGGIDCESGYSYKEYIGSVWLGDGLRLAL